MDSSPAWHLTEFIPKPDRHNFSHHDHGFSASSVLLACAATKPTDADSAFGSVPWARPRADPRRAPGEQLARACASERALGPEKLPKAPHDQHRRRARGTKANGRRLECATRRLLNESWLTGGWPGREAALHTTSQREFDRLQLSVRRPLALSSTGPARSSRHGLVTIPLPPRLRRLTVARWCLPTTRASATE